MAEELYQLMVTGGKPADTGFQSGCNLVGIDRPSRIAAFFAPQGVEKVRFDANLVALPQVAADFIPGSALPAESGSDNVDQYCLPLTGHGTMIVQ